MSLAVALPQFAGDGQPELLARYARRAEELGFSGLWTLDSALGGHTSHTPVLDGLHALSFAAAHTTTARLGVAVVVMPRRVPALLARELASIDRLSRGRLIVGVGLGGSDGSEAALGIPTDRRARRLAEGVEILRAAWSQDPVSYDGELFSFSGVHLEPKPAQQPGPPIWFGAGKRPALRRAARLGDGWIGAGSSATSDFLEQVPMLREELEAAGRDPDAFPKSKRVYVAVDDDADRGRERLAAVLDAMYGRPGLTERVAVCGRVEHVAEELRRLLHAGAHELLLHPLYDWLEQLEALADVRGLALG
jgi:probable F420-dependent oxidoreductase